MKYDLAECISVIEGNIADKKELDKRRIDAVVNAANPTLMGSSQGVDGAIHKAINDTLKAGHCFKHLICDELNTDREEKRIRCQRGEAILTSGYGLCKYVIHVVGAKYDGKSIFNICSSSTVQTLESCYYNIVERMKEHPDIKNIAIPVISSGAYGFPFEFAAKIAFISVYNALVEWKNHDPEMFEMSELEHVYFFVYDDDQDKMRKQAQVGNNILKKYRTIMVKGKRAVFQCSMWAHFCYWKEITDKDESRGYFSVAKRVRELLMVLRLFFIPGMCLKDIIGRADWEKRRRFVEQFTVVKALLPIFFYFLVRRHVTAGWPIIENCVFPFIIIYHICDTITYLVVLIVMTDIQRPSANLIRSMIMLFVNYVEVSMGMAYLYFIYNVIHNKQILSFYELTAFGVLGIRAEDGMTSCGDYFFVFADAGIKFFFITLVFGYFANHMHQRKFRS